MSWLERKIPLIKYTNPKDERINRDTHLFGTMLALAGLFAMLGVIKDLKMSLSLALIIYASTNILLYLSSTLYHALTWGNAKRVFRILDHSNIYILIAGTYTPIVTYVGSKEAYILLGAIWAIAILGIVVTILFWSSLKAVHIALYVVMGWLCVFFWDTLFAHVPLGLIKFLVLGGVSYTAGILFYAVKKIPHNHGIWHLFVLLGSLFFYVGIFIYLT